jgi:hypothetical protein
LFEIGVGFDSCEAVGGAFDARAAVFEDMGVDHRRSDTPVPQQLLNGSDVIAVF